MQSRKVFFLSLIVAASACAAGAAAQVTGWYNPYVEAWTAEAGDLSLRVSPDGLGPGFAEACNGLPQGVADATITLILYSDQPGWGEPVADYPREDIWLMSSSGSFSTCPGGTIADVNTNAEGMTTWATPPKAGGWHDPDEGHELKVWVSGWEVSAPGLAGLRFNSADLTGDLWVNLADISIFAQDYEGPYHYRSDLAWDRVVNIADLAHLARHVGAVCP